LDIPKQPDVVTLSSAIAPSVNLHTRRFARECGDVLGDWVARVPEWVFSQMLFELVIGQPSVDSIPPDR
tara:strand:+ start:640130 stop:640336 length:207 start_codon:yes stop_codon:yes gene_type:complete